MSHMVTCVSTNQLDNRKKKNQPCTDGFSTVFSFVFIWKYSIIHNSFGRTKQLIHCDDPDQPCPDSILENVVFFFISDCKCQMITSHEKNILLCVSDPKRTAA